MVSRPLEIGVSYTLFVLQVGQNKEHGVSNCEIVTDIKKVRHHECSSCEYYMREFACDVYVHTDEMMSFKFSEYPSLKPHKDFKINSKHHNDAIEKILNEKHMAGWCRCGSDVKFADVVSVWFE